MFGIKMTGKRFRTFSLSEHLSFGAFGLTQGQLGGIFRQAFNLVPVFSKKHTVTDDILWTMIIALYSARQPGSR